MKLISQFRLFSILSLLVLNSGCDFKKEKEFPEALTIDMTNNELNLDKDFSELLDNFEYIVLKGVSSEDALSGVDKVVELKNRFYIFDKRKSNILVFNDTGNFLHKVGKRGGGPEEYVSILDFDIDKEKSEVFLLDDQVNLTVYDIENNFVNKVRLPEGYPSSMSFLDKDRVVYGIGDIAPGGPAVKIISSDGIQVLEELAKYPDGFEDMQSFAFTGGVVKSGSEAFFTYRSSSVINKITEDLELEPLYKFNFGPKTWPEDKKFDMDGFNSALHSFDFTILTSNYFIGDNSISFVYMDGRKLRRAIYFIDKNLIYNPDEGVNSSILRFFSVPKGVNQENDLVSGLLYEKYKTYKQLDTSLVGALREINPDFVDDLEKLDYENNAMLIFYDFR